MPSEILRDRLRCSADDRIAYGRLKRELAPRDWYEIGHYAHAKGPLVEAILARAAGAGTWYAAETVLPRSARSARS